MAMMEVLRDSVGPGCRNNWSDVHVVQSMLNRQRQALASTEPPRINGVLGTSTVTAIKRFQSVVLGMRTPDGQVAPGGRTWRQLTTLPRTDAAPEFFYPVGPQGLLAEEARPYLGAREAKGNRMGSDPRMREILEADDLRVNGRTDGYAWCCALVTLCTRKVIRNHPDLFGHMKPPTAAKVLLYLDQWARETKCLIFDATDRSRQVAPGDVAAFHMSHIGIVDHVSEDGNTFWIIEGNTNVKGSRDGVACMMMRRARNQLKAFIRFPVPVGFRTWKEMLKQEAYLKELVAPSVQKQFVARLAGSLRLPLPDTAGILRNAGS